MRFRGLRNRQAHDLINKLSVIIGNCDLLKEMITDGTEQAKRLSVIRAVADEAIKELTKDHGKKLRMRFADVCFAHDPGVSEADSRSPFTRVCFLLSSP
jgi:predicted protein tyrosine phosphatase